MTMNSDVDDRDDDWNLAQPAAGKLLWRPPPTFGAYLRECRLKAGMLLKDAATELHISFGLLQKMETNGRYRAPGLSFLAQIANLYNLGKSELLREAGLNASIPDEVEAEVDQVRAFEPILLYRTLCPNGIDREWCGYISSFHRRQWVDFAYKLEALLHEDLYCVRKILREANPIPPQQQLLEATNPELMLLNYLESTLEGAEAHYWQHRAEFGPFMQQRREEKDISLRDAATALNVDSALLRRIEKGAPVPPPLTLLRSIAYLYGLHVDTVMREAGVREAAIPILHRMEMWNAGFAALVTDPRLRPIRMTPRCMQMLSASIQREWAVFAMLMEHHVRQKGPSLNEIVQSYRKIRPTP